MNLLTAREGKLSVTMACKALGVSRQAFYKYDEVREVEKSLMNHFALEFLNEERQHDKGLGTVKIWDKYDQKFTKLGVEHLGRDAFLDLMRANDLLIRLRSGKKIPQTTFSNHGEHLYQNLVYDVIPTRPDQIWVTDITYQEITGEDGKTFFAYIDLIMDSYTKEVIGWSVGDTLEKEHAIRALEMALSNREVGEDTTHHSDRGVQYASKAYTKILMDHKIKISMTETGNPHDNAEAERLNNTFKNEFFKGVTFNSIKELEDALRDAVDYYNNERPHMSLGNLTPAMAKQLGSGWKKMWHSKREYAIQHPKEKQEEEQYELVPII